MSFTAAPKSAIAQAARRQRQLESFIVFTLHSFIQENMADSVWYYQRSRNTVVNKTDPELPGKLGKQTIEKF